MQNVEFESKLQISKDFANENDENSPACKKLRMHCENELNKIIEQKKTNYEKFDEDMEKIIKELSKMPFLKTFDKFVMEHLLTEPTNLEKFISQNENLEKSRDKLGKFVNKVASLVQW